MNAKEVESLLLKAGFILNRQKGSHRIYKRNNQQIVIPFHIGRELHPKIVKELKNLLSSD